MRWLAVVALLAGCYRPGADPACSTTCDPAAVGAEGACPGSLVCMADGKCHSSDGSCGESDGGLADVRPDDSTDFCYGEGLLRICLQEAPQGALTIGPTFDTTASPNCIPYPQSGGPELCVVAAERVTVTSVTITGPRPLVLIGDTLIITGVVGASSRRGMPSGPGGNSNQCSMLGGGSDFAGGSGGSFGTQGGKGGGEATDSGQPLDVNVLRGGCPGAPGVGNALAVGGSGGGAIYFISNDAITMSNAVITASGAGGSPPSALGGGGGGGSGGMIGFDAPLINVSSSQVFANGGGGAGGSNGNPASPGFESTAYNQGGAAGTGTTNGGNGYSIGIDAADGGPSPEGFTAGGGGGGGGGGVIRIYPASQAGVFGASVSPPIVQ